MLRPGKVADPSPREQGALRPGRYSSRHNAGAVLSPSPLVYRCNEGARRERRRRFWVTGSWAELRRARGNTAGAGPDRGFPRPAVVTEVDLVLGGSLNSKVGAGAPSSKPPLDLGGSRGGTTRLAATARREEGMDSTARSGHRPAAAVGATIPPGDDRVVWVARGRTRPTADSRALHPLRPF